nr:uncharacterized protein LOC106029109 [Cavia porcellus]
MRGAFRHAPGGAPRPVSPKGAPSRGAATVAAGFAAARGRKDAPSRRRAGPPPSMPRGCGRGAVRSPGFLGCRLELGANWEETGEARERPEGRRHEALGARTVLLVRGDLGEGCISTLRHSRCLSATQGLSAGLVTGGSLLACRSAGPAPPDPLGSLGLALGRIPLPGQFTSSCMSSSDVSLVVRHPHFPSTFPLPASSPPTS